VTIRNLPDEVHAALRIRAATDGMSMEAEMRSILTEVCMNRYASPFDLQVIVDQLYKGNLPTNVVDDLIHDRRTDAARE
jgi:plasmid stability protein